MMEFFDGAGWFWCGLAIGLGVALWLEVRKARA